MASATAQVAEGIHQLARGGTDVAAVAGLDNEGLIAIDVNATAQGTGDVTARAFFGTGNFIHHTAAIFELAQGQAGAEATFTNNGTIALAAHAEGVAAGGASASVFAQADGIAVISQGAIASSTQSSFSLTSGVAHHPH